MDCFHLNGDEQQKMCFSSTMTYDDKHVKQPG